MRAVSGEYPRLDSARGTLSGEIDMLPKPTAKRLPLLVTGGSQQSPEWIARHGDGWMTYPRDVKSQARVVADYRERIAEAGLRDKPVMQSLYVDLLEDPSAPPRPIHLGLQTGARHLVAYLEGLESVGVNHVALNLRFQQGDIESALRRLADEVLTSFA